MTLTQLIDLGMTRKAVRHRVATGRLHPKYPGVFAVGRPDLTLEGEWMAAVLACGDGAAASHHTAAMRWGIRRALPGPVHVSVPLGRNPRIGGVMVHRRRGLLVVEHEGIPVTPLVDTMLDIADDLDERGRERMIGEADRLGLLDPETLRGEVEARRGQRGVTALRKTLDRHTFVLTHSELERLFVPIAKRAGLGLPTGQRKFPGGRVDFYWKDLNLVVETDGLTYHRTPTQQSADLYRDHANAARGLRTLRFSHYQIKYDRRHVEATLRTYSPSGCRPS